MVLHSFNKRMLVEYVPNDTLIVGPKKKYVCLLFDENFKRGRSVDFLFYFYFIFYLIWNRVGRSGRFFFSLDFFFHSIFFQYLHKREISPKKQDVIAWMVVIKYPKSSCDNLLLQTSFSDHGDHIFLKRIARRTSSSWIDKNRRYP